MDSAQIVMIYLQFYKACVWMKTMKREAIAEGNILTELRHIDITIASYRHKQKHSLHGCSFPEM